MPEGMGRNRIGVCVKDPIDLTAGQMTITASWEQVGIFRLRPAPEILTNRIHHLVTEIHYPHLIPLAVPHRDFPGLKRDIFHSKLLIRNPA